MLHSHVYSARAGTCWNVEFTRQQGHGANKDYPNKLNFVHDQNQASYCHLDNAATQKGLFCWGRNILECWICEHDRNNVLWLFAGGAAGFLRARLRLLCQWHRSEVHVREVEVGVVGTVHTTTEGETTLECPRRILRSCCPARLALRLRPSKAYANEIIHTRQQALVYERELTPPWVF